MMHESVLWAVQGKLGKATPGAERGEAAMN